MGEYRSEDIAPLVGVGLVGAGSGRVRWWMEVFAAVVIVRVSIPATFPRIAAVILFGVMDAEIVGLEPPDTEIRAVDTARKVAQIVVGDDGVRRVFGLPLDPLEASAAPEARGDPIE